MQEGRRVGNWLPEEFRKEMQQILGREYEQYLESFERPVSLGLRVNTLKWGRHECMEKLPYRTEPIPWISNGLFYEGGARLSKDPYYFAGLYYLQEPSAMTPASLLPVEPGDMVLDICAAPGGKSTELGARLMGKGMLVANDISNSRAKALLKNLEMFGISNLCVASETPERLGRAFQGFFDKILADVPCSGEGMFRKDGGMVKDWVERGPGYYTGIQREIAGEAVKMLKEGGYLLYSTCTFSREEDEGAIQWILEEFPEMELVPLKPFEGASDGIGLTGCIRLFPHKIRGEGHFAALLRKTAGKEQRPDQGAQGGDGCCVKGKMWRGSKGYGGRGQEKYSAGEFKRIKRIGGNNRKEYGKGTGKERAGREESLMALGSSVGLGEELGDFLGKTGLRWDVTRIMERNDMVYYLPEGFVKDTGLRFLRTGLWMGSLKNGRFEPSQAMAMVLSGELYTNSVSFGREDPRVVRYLKGETISLEQGEPPVKGWCLVCVDGFALGFGKGNGMTIKNKYYAGWRWQ